MEEPDVHDMEPVRPQWFQTGRRLSAGGQRRSCSPTGGDWVVRRRSDGSRYVGRRRRDSATRRRSAEKTHGRTDPARRSQPRSTSRQLPADYHRQHGCAGHNSSFDEGRKAGDVMEQRTAADHGDYSTEEWIFSPKWTDSSYHIFAVI